MLVLGHGPMPGLGPREFVLFGHRATSVGAELVVDYTARQFDQKLPARWVTDPADYARTLAARAGAARIELLLPPGRGRAADR